MLISAERLARAIDVRRMFHARPELSFEEEGTASLICASLSRCGYEVRIGVAGTGLIGTMKGGHPGPVIALRADMDALPIVECSGKPYASAVKGVMHACGHDGHSASLLLAAELLADRRADLRGEVRVIFQPGEERGTGAKAMIAEGALKGVDRIYGYHNRPGFPLGEVFVKSGAAMAGNIVHRIGLRGRGGHAAMPNLTADPLFAGAAIVQALQTIRASRMSPLESGVLTVTKFAAGDAPNVIADKAELITNGRFFSRESGEILSSALERIVGATAAAHGVDAQIDVLMELPVLVNSIEIAEETALIAMAEFALPRPPLIDFLPTMGSEDFACYLEETPGCFFFVGNGEDSAYLHSPHYDYRDELLPIAARMFVALALAGAKAMR